MPVLGDELRGMIDKDDVAAILTLTIARPTAAKIKAFGMEFHTTGKSAFSAPFSWSA